MAATSSDAAGCTAGTDMYDVSMKMLNVKLVDTAGRSSSPLFMDITELDYRSG